jgi:hypothetical protein
MRGNARSKIPGARGGIKPPLRTREPSQRRPGALVLFRERRRGQLRQRHRLAKVTPLRWILTSPSESQQVNWDSQPA